MEYFDSVEVVVEGYSAIFSGANDPLKLQNGGEICLVQMTLAARKQLK